jgi:hypothetical protein
MAGSGLRGVRRVGRGACTVVGSADRALDATETTDAILRAMLDMQQRQTYILGGGDGAATTTAPAEGVRRLERDAELENDTQAADSRTSSGIARKGQIQAGPFKVCTPTHST